MHSSRMCTSRLLTICWSLLPGGCLLPEGCLLLGVSAPGGVFSQGVSALGGVCSLGEGGVSAPGGLLWGVSAPRVFAPRGV